MNIPPLNTITKSDVAFLDRIPLEESEWHGRTGKYKEKRWLSRKTLADLQFLMNYCIERVKDAGGLVDVTTPESVDEMYKLVAAEFKGSGRDSQKKWTTVVNELRRSKKRRVSANNNNS